MHIPFSKTLESNLFRRAISGAVFVALIVSSILLHSYFFLAFFALVCGMSVLEFRKLTSAQEQVNVNPVAAFLGGVLLFVCSYISASGLSNFPVYMFYGLYVAFLIILELYRKQPNPLHNMAYFFYGQAVVALPFSLLNYILFINEYQPLILLSVFVTIWVNDTGAYLVGVTCGRHRLFERISPKKSWEGFFGGVVAAAISGYVFSIFLPQMTMLQWIFVSEVLVVAGTYGDLSESLLKRTVQVKDSGTIIPGHGGLLDRFDSMLLAAPVFYIVLSVLKYMNILF